MSFSIGAKGYICIGTYTNSRFDNKIPNEFIVTWNYANLQVSKQIVSQIYAFRKEKYIILLYQSIDFYEQY